MSLRHSPKRLTKISENIRALNGVKLRALADSLAFEVPLQQSMLFAAKGNKQQASGHKTVAMLNVYDHELPRVEPADD